jgi:uncharacterized protein involved in exopolysaccharide biosynthesis
MYRASATLTTQSTSADTGTSLAAARVLLASEAAASRVITDLQLDTLPYELTPSAFIENHLRIEAPLGTNYLRVHVTLGNPELAARAANSLVATVAEMGDNIDKQKPSYPLIRLERDLKRARIRQEELTSRLVEHRRSPPPKGDAELYEHDVVGYRLEQEHEAATRIYLDLFTQVERGRLGLLENPVLIALVDPAVPNPTPVRVPASLIILLGAVAGLAFSMVIVIGRHLFESKPA